MSEWINSPETIEHNQGFVYEIKDKKTGKFYIGKKFFWSKRTLKPLKGKKRKRHVVVESDWRNYWGSCKTLLEDLEKYGKDRFSRTVLRFCKTKFECAYYELQEQIERKVMFRDDCYNGIINVRLRKPKRS